MAGSRDQDRKNISTCEARRRGKTWTEPEDKGALQAARAAGFSLAAIAVVAGTRRQDCQQVTARLADVLARLTGASS
jgi:hypothetical protein